MTRYCVTTHERGYPPAPLQCYATKAKATKAARRARKDFGSRAVTVVVKKTKKRSKR